MKFQLLIVGEIYVDFTTANHSSEAKLRLGGIVHAARGAWAANVEFSVAAYCPAYLVNQARKYLEAFGCNEFHLIGDIIGSPNIMIIGDQLEISDQGYEDILRDEKTIVERDTESELNAYSDILVIPGRYQLSNLRKRLSEDQKIHIDIAYDIKTLDDLTAISDLLETIIISTSSDLFLQLFRSDIAGFTQELRKFSDTNIVLKENRGGLRVIPKGATNIIVVPALLGNTKNSVGVGDVFDSVFVSCLSEGIELAAWRGGRACAAYSQTTYPDTFKDYYERSCKLSLRQMKSLSGVAIAWEDRPKFPIYLAAPDFSYVDVALIEEVVSSLKYHNFTVRRPVKENGELPKNAEDFQLSEMYLKDVELLDKCRLVFAIPLNRDPGTLVEMGIAIDRNIPVVTFDPNKEVKNTMYLVALIFIRTHWIRASERFLKFVQALKMNSVILLASGGLDSTTLAYWLGKENKNVLPIFFDYGQHCVEKEWETLNSVLPDFCMPAERIDISGIFIGSNSRMIIEADLWNEPVVDSELYIPYRTLLFFSAAAARAQSLGVNHVFSGFINSNHAKELDCSMQFINSVENVMHTIGEVKIICPFREFSKADVARTALSLGVPIGQTFSCQVYSDTPCGACPNCVDRIAGVSELVKS